MTWLLSLLIAAAFAQETPPHASSAPATAPEFVAPTTAPQAGPAATVPIGPAVRPINSTPAAKAPAAQPRPKPAAPAPVPVAPLKPVAQPAPVETGHVADGVIRFGRDIDLTAGQSVSGPVVALGGSVSVDTTVQGPVLALGGSVKLGPRAVIDGPVVALGGAGVQLDPAAKVNGPVLDVPGARLLSRVLAPLLTVVASLAALAVFGKLLAGIGWIIVGVVLWTMFPEALRNTRDALERQTAACVVWGVFAWPALGAIGLAFLVSLIGLPLVPLVALLGAAAYVWGSVAVAFWIGSRLGRSRWESSLLSIVLGLILLKVLAFIPVIRWLALIATAVLGAGAAFASRFGFRGPGLVAPAVPK